MFWRNWVMKGNLGKYWVIGKFIKTKNLDGVTFLDYENGKFELSVLLWQSGNEAGQMTSLYEISITYHK